MSDKPEWIPKEGKSSGGSGYGFDPNRIDNWELNVPDRMTYGRVWKDGSWSVGHKADTDYGVNYAAHEGGQADSVTNGQLAALEAIKRRNLHSLQQPEDLQQLDRKAPGRTGLEALPDHLQEVASHLNRTHSVPETAIVGSWFNQHPDQREEQFARLHNNIRHKADQGLPGGHSKNDLS